MRRSAAGAVALLAACFWPAASFPAGGSAIEPTVYAHAGLDHFYNLEYAEAIEDLQQAIEGDPDNLIFYNFLTNTYLFQELYRLGQLEGNLYASSNKFLEEKKPEPDPERIKLIHDRIDEVKKRCDRRLEKNPRDMDALYAKGIARAMEANMAFTIEKKWFDALRAGSDANDLHKKVLKIDRNYHDAKVVRGVYEYVVGSIPWSVKWVAFLIGYRGSKEKGIELLKDAMVHGKWTSSDAAVLLGVIYTREKEHQYARRLFRKVADYYPRNPLYFLEIGRSYERDGKPGEALEIYHTAAERLEAGQPGYPEKVPYDRLYYEIGSLHQKLGQFDSALEAYAKIIQHEDSDTRLKAQAALQRGDIYKAKKQTEQARSEYQMAASLPHEEIQQKARERLRSLGQ